MISKTAELKAFPVFGSQGQIGEVLASSRFLDERPEKTVRLLDGRELQVPSSSLQIQDDGTFYLATSEAISPPDVPRAKDSPSRPVGEAAPVASAEPAAPVAPAEPVRVAPPADALFEMGYDVETVRVDKVVDGPVSQRQEGDVLIFPVVEEVWVVEKRLLLREEIRIKPRKREVGQIRTIEKH